MSTWTCELSWDSFNYTADPAPSIFRRSEWKVGLEAIALPLTDPFPPFNASPDLGDFFLSVGISDDGTAFQGVQVRFSDAEIKPPSWVTPVSLQPIFSGANPALLTAGGTLSITKDFAGNLMTFTGPLGTQTVALTVLDPGGATGYNNNQPLRPRGYVAEFAMPDPIDTTPAYDVHDGLHWFNLIGRQNGVAYDTVALSAADPGVWWPIYTLAFDPVSGTQTVDPQWWTYTQLTTRQQVAADVLAATFPFYRIFDSWKRRRAAMAANEMDMVTMPAHDIIFAAWHSMPAEIMVRRSHDHGHSWTDYVVESATTGDSPSIQCFASQVWVCYHNGTQPVTQHSMDLGITWSTPLAIGITGTNPRLVIDPTGLQFYFYVTGGNLVLSRSTDLGATLFDPTPILVAAGVAAQDFGVVRTPDGALVVSYISSGSWVGRRSPDMGLTWTTL